MEHDLTNLRAACKALTVWAVEQQINPRNKDNEEKMKNFWRQWKPLIDVCDTMSDEQLTKGCQDILNNPESLDRFPEDLRNRFLVAAAIIT